MLGCAWILQWHPLHLLALFKPRWMAATEKSFFKYVRFAGAPGLSMADRARDCKREVDVQHHDNLVQALAFDSIHRRKTQQIAPVCIETRLIRTFKSTFGSIVNVKRFQGGMKIAFQITKPAFSWIVLMKCEITCAMCELLMFRFN